MSMYGLLMGRSPDSGALLTALGLTMGDVARFRDAHLADGEIAIYTRLGGGNRECWCEDGAPHECYQPAIQALQSHPLYLRDQDDAFDCTYATFYFRCPEGGVAATDIGAWDPDGRWAKVITALRTAAP